LRPLIRRPTGGGLVPHDADWTYSVVSPPVDPWCSLRAIDSYRRMHEWIRAAFAEMKVATELSSCCRKESPGQCFAGAERFDVLLNGRKLAGAAQRWSKDGLLIQGSIQPPAGIERRDFESAMLHVANRVEGVTWAELTRVRQPSGTLR
jgi:lipoate-protein ligase A